MSSELREKMTLAEWIDGFYSISIMRKKEAAREFRTDEEKAALIAEQEAIFEGVDPGQLSCAIIYLVQILRKENAEGTIYLLEMLADIIKTEEVVSKLPEALRKFLYSVANIQEN